MLSWLSALSVPEPRLWSGSFGILDLDHVGAQHAQLIGRERPSQHVRDVDHPDAFERTHGEVLPALRGSIQHVQLR